MSSHIYISPPAPGTRHSGCVRPCAGTRARVRPRRCATARSEKLRCARTLTGPARIGPAHIGTAVYCYSGTGPFAFCRSGWSRTSPRFREGSRPHVAQVCARSCSDPVQILECIPVFPLPRRVGWVLPLVRGCVGVYHCRTYTKAVRGGESEVHVLRAARA